MKHDSVEVQRTQAQFSVYECELNLKFRLIEEQGILSDRDALLEYLLEALACGQDEYLETIESNAQVQEVSEFEASPRMRRQLIRLRNARDCA